MSTQTGSISFEATGGFNSYAKQNYATLSQIKGQFATCGTGASTAAKIATIVPTDSGWALYEGATVTVKFTSKNTTSAPTLNVNGTGAKPIKDFNGNDLTQAAYEWPEGAAMSFTYDGSSWRLQDSNLMERVHTAETAIEQNANEISLRATKEEVDNTIDDVKITRSGEGASVVIEDSAEFPPIEITAKGWAEQDGTPTPDNPVEVRVARGRNLLPFPYEFADRTESGVTFKTNNDGSITITGTATANVSSNLNLATGLQLSGTYTLSTGRTDLPNGFTIRGFGSNVNNTPMTFNLNGTYNIYMIILSGTTMNHTIYPQLELGSTPTPYVPYGHVGLEVRNATTQELVDIRAIPLPLKSDGERWAGGLPDGTADSLAIDSAGRWEWESVTTVRTLNGGSSEEWGKYDAYHGFMALGFLPASMNRAYGFCSIMPVVQEPLSADTLQCWFGVNTPILYLCGVQTALSITTVSDWRSWLASNPVTVLYPLATPTTEHAYIDLPTIPEGATITIPELAKSGIKVSWWTKSGQEAGNAHQSSVKENAELRIAADGITSEVSKISSAKYVTTGYNYTLAQIKTYAAEGYSGTWTIASTPDIRIGDTIYLKVQDTTRVCPVYIKTTVTAVNSDTSIKCTSHGYEDVLPVDTIKSTINQSADSVKIAANHVDIEGAAIFSSGGAYDKSTTVVKSETQWYSSISATSKSGGSWGTTQPTVTAGRYIWQRELVTYANGTTAYKPSEAGVCTQGQTDLSSYSTTTQMNSAIGTAVNNIEIGGRNLVIDSKNFRAGSVQSSSTMNQTIENGMYKMTISEGNTANWNSGWWPNKDPNWSNVEANLKTGDPFVISFRIKATGSTIKPTIYIKPGLGYYSMVGTLSSDWSTIYYTGVWNDSETIQPHLGWSGVSVASTYYIESVKLEKGNKPTDWTPAPEDVQIDVDAAAEVMGGYTILWNYENFTAANNGEAYICKLDPLTGTKSDENGWVKWNGTKRTITKQMVNPNTVLPYNIPIYIVCRLSSATATTGTNYMVWYNSGWKYAAMPTPSAIGGTWTWTEATDIILGKFVEPASEAAFVEMELYNPPWGAKQLTTDTTTAHSAQNTANNAAPKTSAVSRTQRIYYQSASTTKPATPGTASSDWVSDESGAADKWTLKRMSYSSAKPYIYTCEQKQVVSGTVSYTPVLLDDTTTVIDGGKIITGSVTANALNASNINASNMLTIGAFNSNTQNSILNSEVMDELVSRGEQLVINGSAFMGDNTNFSSWTYDGMKANVSGGSFTHSVQYSATFWTDEFIPIDGNSVYEFSFDAVSESGDARLYGVFYCYDIDNNAITAADILYINGSTTTLAQDLKSGDTYVYLTDVSGFDPNGVDVNGAYSRSLIFWDYTNSKGYRYPVETYSRHHLSYDKWAAHSNIDYTNNRIQLKAAYSGTTIPAGTPVSQGNGGSTYEYPAAVNALIPSSWQHYSGYVHPKGVTVPTGTNATLRPGTAKAKVGFLWNYGGSSSKPQSQIWVTNVSLMKWRITSSETIEQTQQIYYRSSSSSVPSGTGLPTTWVTATTDLFATTNIDASKWSLKASRLTANADGTGTKYPYLWTCTQKKTLDGTVSYGTIALDDTTTIIDGGKIITGSVQANAIKADSGTFNTANIPNLSAAKITSGDIAADRIKTNVVNAINATVNQIDAKNIKASELQIGQSQVTNLTNDIADAKKHTQVIVSASNVNYAANTCTLTARLYIDGVLQTSTSLKWQWYRDGTAQGSQMTGATGTLDVTSTLGIGHRYSCKCTF